MCTQDEFKKLVEETLSTEGKAKSGCWSLQVNGHNARIKVELALRLNGVAFKATLRCDTENRSETIQTAIITMEEAIDKKINKMLDETYGN